MRPALFCIAAVACVFIAARYAAPRVAVIPLPSLPAAPVRHDPSPVVLPPAAAARVSAPSVPAPRAKKPPSTAVSLSPAIQAPVSAEPKRIPEIPIAMPSVVVVKCVFSQPDTGASLTAFGSGAIVSASGYVLTARHVVDIDYAYRVTGGKQGASGYRLVSCSAGGAPDGSPAPSPAEIRAINPFTVVASLPYLADIALIPALSGEGMSSAERDFYDVAILKISGVTDDARKFFGASMPASFPASRLIATALPGADEEIVTFGFPSGAPAYGDSFRLQGSVGAVGRYVVGDARFANEPLGIEARMETIGGRSGSPVFWRGHVVGVVSSKHDYSTDATVISAYPLAELLKGSGIALDGL